MKAVLSIRFRMYLAVKRELQAIVNAVGVAGLSALLDVLTAKIEEVSDLRAIQTEPTAPKTTTRNDALGEMIATALAVAGPLGAHAHQQGLHEIRAIADVTAYSFKQLRPGERPMVAQQIHDAALPLVVALTPLGVTEQMIAELQTQIDAAKAILNEPRTTIIEKRKATRDLDTLFAGIDELLEEEIDRVMAPLELTHPDLHQLYFDARKMARRSQTAEEPATAPATLVAPAIAAPPPVEKAA